MKYVNKSAIAVFVFGVISAGSMNVTKAADVYVKLDDNASNAPAGAHIQIQGTDQYAYNLDDIRGENVTQNGKIYNLQGDIQKEDTAISTLNQKVDDNKTDQTFTDNIQDTLINSADYKASMALQQNIVNSSNITTLQTDVGSLQTDVSKIDQQSKQAGAIANTADNKADAALQGVVKNGSDIIAVDAKADNAQRGVNANSQLITTLNQKVDDNKADQISTDNKQDALINITDSKADMALQQNIVNGSNIATLQTDVGSLQTDVSKIDQQSKQAGAIANTANNKADAALQGVVKNGSDIIAVDAKADKAESDALLAGVKADAANTAAQAAQGKADFDEVKADNAQKTANTALSSATDANTKADANTTVLATKVDTSTFQADQNRQDQALQDASNKATQAINTGAYTQSVAVDAQTVAAANKAAVANVQSRQQAQETAIQNHSNQLANHEQRITELENQNNNFQNLKDDVDNNRKRAAVGVASVAAMSNIPQVTDSQTFAIGAGVGGYDSQGAVAIGVSAHITDHIVTKASVGAGSFGGATYGAGVSFGF